MGVLSALLLLAVPSVAANILTNPGFETGGLAPWFNSIDYCGVCAWSVSDANSHGGDYSATVQGDRLLEQDFAPVSTALISEVSLWLTAPGGGGSASFYLEYSDTTFEQGVLTLGDVWAKYDLTSYLDPGKSLVAVGVYGCSGCIGPYTYADDFLVDAGVGGVPEPSTGVLLTLGGLGFATLRMRRRR